MPELKLAHVSLLPPKFHVIESIKLVPQSVLGVEADLAKGIFLGQIGEVIGSLYFGLLIPN